VWDKPRKQIQQKSSISVFHRCNLSTESTPTYKELHRGDPIVSRVPFYYGWVMMVVSLFALIFTSPG